MVNKNEIQKLTEDIYWGFDTSKEILPNILLSSSLSDYSDNPVLEFIDVMRQPENFWFTCKWLFGLDMHPIQLVILQELWNRKFPMMIATRGFGKSFLMSVYALLRALFHQGCKIIVVGAAFRQSKILFEYMETIYRNSPIFQNIIEIGGKREGPRRDIDRCTFRIGESEIISLPIGDGSKIRGLRANYVLADEFAAIPLEIFEIVIRGFGSVSSDPIEKVWGESRIKALQSLGMMAQADEELAAMGFGNQTVISGTASYHFNHFYTYWKQYKNIIESGGDRKKLEEVFSDDVPENFDHTQYSIMRIPYTMLPYGYMDTTQVAQAKALTTVSIYHMEYGAIFSEDSDGFFKRSVIERCVCKGEGIDLFDEIIRFSAQLSGDPNKYYIYGIDPAFANDNFSIVILEVNKTHRRIVYCWTVNKNKLKDRLSKEENTNKISFYNFCARKIRNLMRVFPTEHIGMDAQGGGIAVMEALHEEKQLEGNEQLIWAYRTRGEKDPFWWEKADKPTDGEAGLHILHMVQFANADFTSQCNHGLAKDLESKTILFPEFDSVELSLSYSEDKMLDRFYDTLEDCVMEIEELKDELTTISHSQTPSGRDKWDTPEIKLTGNKKGRMRKDRYSALIIANQLARILDNALKDKDYQFVGGYVGEKKFSNNSNVMYIGPDYLVEQLNQGMSGKIIPR